MKKSGLYTKGGDKGETSLVSGTRVSKGAMQIDLYGEVDELNSHIGYLVSLCQNKTFLTYDLEKFFESLQSSLFDLGSNLACEAELWDKYKLPKISLDLIREMELLIDKLDGSLPALKSFILPGGSIEASYAHIVRTTI